VSRALRTIDRSQDLGLKMLKQPPHKQMDYYYSKLLGKDWQQQLEQVRGCGLPYGHQCRQTI
jgi:hypothetical protein